MAQTRVEQPARSPGALGEDEGDLFALLFESAPIGTALVDLDGRIVRANRALSHFLRRRRSDLEGHFYVEFTDPADLAEIRRSVARLRADDRQTVQAERRFVREDGSAVWALVSASVVRFPNGPPRVVLRLEDITRRRQAEDTLQESERRFRSLVQHSSDLIVAADRDGIPRHVSPSAVRMLGTTPGELVDRSVLPLVHADDRDQLRAAFARALEQPGVPITVVCRARHADGQWRDIEAVLTNHLDDVDVGAVMISARDVTDRVRAEAHLAAQAAILEMIACDQPLQDVLSAIVQLLHTGLTGSRCSILLREPESASLRKVAPTEAPAAVDLVWRSPEPDICSCAAGIDGGTGRLVTDMAAHPTCRTRALSAITGGLRACWSIPLLAAGSGDVLGVVRVFRNRQGGPDADEQRILDLSIRLAQIALERSRSRSQLAYQSMHDPLTGLPNRALFLDRLAVALGRSERRNGTTAVLFLDLDRFKVVNDSLGHDAGDRLLVAVAERLDKALRPGDTLARFGGDEFTVLCEDVAGPDEARGIAEELAALTADPFLLGDQEVFLTLSIGIAVAGTSGDGPEGLLRDADAAMYRAKERGRSCHEVFEAGLRARAVERLKIEASLRRALDRGELLLYYQPEVSLFDGRLHAVEALLRWRHPDRGLLLPGDFLAAAEETGLIVPIGEWVLGEACRQAMTWRGRAARCRPPVVWVNLSPRQLADPALPATVQRALDESGLPASGLCLEITESTLMGDAEATLAALQSLKRLGVSLAVDDFGTGYSSLSYLSRFPVDALKVDRSFVRTIGECDDDSTIVAAVVGLGRALGLTVVAEGVETLEQMARLRALGCEMAQGYWFAPPRPATAVDALLRAGGIVAGTIGGPLNVA